MWNQTAEGDEFVRELSLQLVEQFAPEELDVFDELYADYRRDPSPPVAGQGRDDALGSMATPPTRATSTQAGWACAPAASGDQRLAPG